MIPVSRTLLDALVDDMAEDSQEPSVIVPDISAGNWTSSLGIGGTADVQFTDDEGASLDSDSDVTTTLNRSLLGVNDIPQFYEPLYKAIGCAFVGVIFAVGLIGNLMVVLVVWRTRSMRTPTNCYLVSLAVADILLLISAPLPTLIEFFLIVDQSVFGAVGCAAMVSERSYSI
jgi:hypothetical protein